MNSTPLNIVELNPKGEPKISVIWLHGLGADGHDFVPIVTELNLPETAGIRFVFPHAPQRPVTLNNGYIMRAWYDIYPDFGDEDEVGIRVTQQQINDLIEQEIKRGIPAEKIILAGFSQGGAMALYCGLRYVHKLGGILALSTYLPLATQLVQEANMANQTIPIFMAHGRFDEIIYLNWAEQSLAFLQQHGYTVDFHVYAMAHQVCNEELQDIRNWLLRQI